MTIEVEGPDGTIYEFPDGTSREVMADAMRRRFTKSGGIDLRPREGETGEQYRARIKANRAEVLAKPSEGHDSPSRGEFNRQIGGFAYRLGDNLVGYDDGVMSPGEKAATLLNMGGESLTGWLAGDEAAAAMDANLPDFLGGPRGTYEERLAFHRGNEAQMRAEHPVLSFGADVAPAFLTGAGLLGATSKLASPLSRVIGGGLAGGAMGGLAGFMEGEGGAGNRVQNSVLPGLLGAGLGAAAEPASRVASWLYGAIGPGAAATARKLTKQAKLDKTGAEIVSDAVAKDTPYMAPMGPNAINAQAGHNTMGLLDWLANRPGATGAKIQAKVGELAAQGGERLKAEMDSTLGLPEGVARTQRRVMQDTKAGRRAAYDAAYNSPIDYSQAQGLESLLERIPPEAWNRAQKLMQAEGEKSQQILAQVGADGTVKLSRLPDVRELDYVTRALRDMSDPLGGFGKETGGAYKSLASQVRSELDALVPDYKAARASGADAIANREAADFGSTLLTPAVKMDVAEDAIGAMTDAEKAFARQGVRDYFEEVMANTKSALTDGNMDAREALRPMKELLTRANKRKLGALMGDDAETLIGQAEETYAALSLRAGISQNSKTAPRLIAQETLDRAVPPTMGEALAEGKGLLGAVANASRAFMESPHAARLARQEGVMSKIGEALLSPAGTKTGTNLALLRQLSPALQAAAQGGQSVGLLARLGLGGLATTTSASKAR